MKLPLGSDILEVLLYGAHAHFARQISPPRNDFFSTIAPILQSRFLRQNATTLRKTAHLSQPSFYAIVDHLNLMTTPYTAPLQRRIVFGVVKFTDPAGGVRLGGGGEVGGDADKKESKGAGDKNWKKHVFVKCRVIKTGGTLFFFL